MTAANRLAARRPRHGLSSSSIRQLRLLLLILLVLIAPPVSATYDLVQRYYSMSRDGKSLDRLAISESALPATLLARLANAGLSWDALSGLLQRALLWDAGLVQTSSSALTQLYVPQGRTMSEIQLDLEVVRAATANSTCDLDKCGAPNYFLLGACSTQLVADVARCAVSTSSTSNASTAQLQSGAYWAEDGQSVSVVSGFRAPEPILRRHSALAAPANATLFAIHLEDASFEGTKSCAIQNLFIVPCRAHRGADETYGLPEIGMTTQLWLDLVQAQKRGNMGTATMTVVVILVAALLFAGLGGAAAVLLHCRRQHERHSKAASSSAPHSTRFREPQTHFERAIDAADGGSNDGDDHALSANDVLLAQSPVLRDFVSDPTILTKRIAVAQITLLRVLARGASGEVWLGQVESRYVAMKCLLPTKRQDVRWLEMFTDEIRLAAALEHPRIVRFCGVAWHALASLSLVTEFLERGDLEAFLARDDATRLTWMDDKLAIALDVADALAYLHSLVPIVLHRDLKSKNILLDAHMRAKLSDFGLSRESSTDDTMTSGVGTILWSAPEVLDGRAYDQTADIFSFGVVLSELDTCALPYGFRKDKQRSKMQSMQIVHLVAQGKLRPTFREDCPSEIVELARQCLDLDPTKRPTALQVVHALRSKLQVPRARSSSPSHSQSPFHSADSGQLALSIRSLT